ncbi:hypothetical protein F2P81_014461 [Scophthalmus maximus]|uniref:Uncharacterized protein n=1 Tax=Scophthalmus maximus TaxID=52904 RepID=A0A6A4SM04_SCOMX|nr:hypothetical protein F2P81_014461 [Scophthalmus maximus]
MSEGEVSDAVSGGEAEQNMESADLLRSGLKNFKIELRTEFSTFREDVKKEMKKDLQDFSRDINRKLTDTTTQLATHTERIEAAETTIHETDSWNMEVKDALLQSLKQQKVLQDKLTDQEGRNRRNNVRIFGLTEWRAAPSLNTLSGS